MPEENRRLSGRDHRPETSLRHKTSPTHFHTLLFSASLSDGFISVFPSSGFYLKARWQPPHPLSYYMDAVLVSLPSGSVAISFFSFFLFLPWVMCRTVMAHYSSCHLSGDMKSLWHSSNGNNEAKHPVLQTHWIYTCMYFHSLHCFYACPFIFLFLCCCAPSCFTWFQEA